MNRYELTAAAEAAALEALEPVAWCREWQGDVSDLCAMIFEDGPDKPDDGHEWTPLYPAPVDQTARIALLERLLAEAHITMNHASIFIATREKMHPTGQELYGKLCADIAAALEKP
jgi:hypothetical protein